MSDRGKSNTAGAYAYRGADDTKTWINIAGMASGPYELRQTPEELVEAILDADAHRGGWVTIISTFGGEMVIHRDRIIAFWKKVEA